MFFSNNWELCYILAINSMRSYWKLVLITIGTPKKLGTLSSISECVFIKLSVKSGNVLLSLWHCPGRGSGTLLPKTGNQLEFMAACSLKFPSKVSVMSWRLKAHTALPDMLFGGVVKVPYINWALVSPYLPSIKSEVDSKIKMFVRGIQL